MNIKLIKDRNPVLATTDIFCLEYLLSVFPSHKIDREISLVMQYVYF